MIAGKSTAVIEPMAYWPMPGPAEHHLHHERAAQQVSQLDAERCDDAASARSGARAATSTARSRETLGPRRPHVVGADHLGACSSA